MSTAGHGTPRAPADPRHVTFGLVVLVGGATALALGPVPVPVRSVIVLPVLVLVAGSSAADLVLGRRAGNGMTDGRPDGVLRILLTVLLGLLSLLGSALLLTALGIPISPRAVPVVTAVVTLALLLLARWQTVLSGQSIAGEPATLSGRLSVRTVLGVATAVFVLAAAVAGAVAMQPRTVERYTQISLDDPGVLRGELLTVHAGADVGLTWTMHSYGFSLTDPDPTVGVTIGGVPARGMTVQPSTPVPDHSGAGLMSRQDGTVDFTAPAHEGLYTVRITVIPRGTPVSAPSVLVVTMRVSP